MNKKRDYTVLLLRPDWLADGFGQDTYLDWVKAESAEEAIRMAREDVVKCDAIDDAQAADYYVLLTIQGRHSDLTKRPEGE